MKNPKTYPAFLLILFAQFISVSMFAATTNSIDDRQISTAEFEAARAKSNEVVKEILEKNHTLMNRANEIKKNGLPKDGPIALVEQYNSNPAKYPLADLINSKDRENLSYILNHINIQGTLDDFKALIAFINNLDMEANLKIVAVRKLSLFRGDLSHQAAETLIRVERATRQSQDDSAFSIQTELMHSAALEELAKSDSDSARKFMDELFQNGSRSERFQIVRIVKKLGDSALDNFKKRVTAKDPSLVVFFEKLK